LSLLKHTNSPSAPTSGGTQRSSLSASNGDRPAAGNTGAQGNVPAPVLPASANAAGTRCPVPSSSASDSAAAGSSGAPRNFSASSSPGGSSSNTGRHQVLADKHLTVVVTRDEAYDGPLSAQLRSVGVNVINWPAVHVAEADSAPLAAALRHINTFDWVVFASRHAVAAIIAHLPTPPEKLKVAAIGSATAQVLKQRGWRVDLMPDASNAASLVTAFEADSSVHGARILYPASSRALPTLAHGLTQLGAHVEQVEAYQTEAAPLDARACRELIDQDVIGFVTFASPSAVIELEHTLDTDYFNRLLTQARSVAIGPTTAQALRERGHSPVVAESSTITDLAIATLRLMQTKD